MSDDHTASLDPFGRDDPIDDHVEHRPFAAGPTILGFQAAGLGAAGIAALAGVGVGSTAMRIGVGLLFLALGAVAAGIAVSLSEGQPQAGGAAVVFDTFTVVLALLWLEPIAGLVTAAVAVAVFAAVATLAPRLALTSRADGRLELRDGLGPPRA
jgi:hypothetical protein